MKKYIAPTLTVMALAEITPLCSSIKRDAKWGGDPNTSNFANPDWENQGYEKKEDTGGSPIIDDNGGLNSMGKVNDWVWDD